MKKVLALIMTMAMMLGMITTVFAADPEYSITIDTTKTGHTYEIYEIFTGDLSVNENGEKVLSNIVWGDGISDAGKAAAYAAFLPEGKEATAANLAEALVGKDAKAFASTIAAYLQNAKTNFTEVKTGEGENATLAGYTSVVEKPGYYLVKDSDDELTEKNDMYTDYIVQVLGKTNLAPKGDIPKVDKVILDTDPTNINEASIGDTVNYQVTGTLPSNIADYNHYFYRFTDTMSKGLTYNDDLEIKIGDIDVTEYFYESATEYDAEDGTTITVSIEDLYALEGLDGVTINAATEIVLTYSGTLNKNAVIAVAGNPNEVDLEYSNDPNHSGNPRPDTPPTPPTPPHTPPTPGQNQPTGVTPKDKVETFVTELTITKVDGETKNILTGAGFTLTSTDGSVVMTKVTKDVFEADENGEYWKLKDGTYTTEEPKEDAVVDGVNVTGTVDKYDSTTTKYAKSTVTSWEGKQEDGTITDVTGMVGGDGKLTFTGLGAGSYTITESTTPVGYNTIDPITFAVTFDKDTQKFASTNPAVTVNGATNALETTIDNFKGAVLPSTGGIGTTIFYALGGVLVVFAGVLLITKRRVANL